jgi:2-(1,2-epoxy-1,2-dihydrophenyl)acetyl-CoA isomerase
LNLINFPGLKTSISWKSALTPLNMNLETVIYEMAGNVATIRLNRPDALNALSSQLGRDLSAAINQALSDGARAVVLTGNGRAFCAGGDLREMQQIGQADGRPEAFLDQPLKELHGIISAIRTAPVPFVAAVNGICAGAGVNFAMACDIVLAAENAAFRQAFVRIGLTPDCGGTFFLPRAIGEKLAAELLMTGDSVEAERAVQIGMVNKVVQADSLLEEAGALAARLAAGPTASIGRIKRMLNESFSNDLEAQLALEAECQLESGQGSDFTEGVAAFFEKRAPSFTGR